MVVVVFEALQPAASAGLTAPPERVKAVDPHRDRLKPLFDIVSLIVVELTAQLAASEGSQIARRIDQKFGVRDIVVLGDSVEKRRRGI